MIPLIARNPTIKKDDSFFQAQRIINEQKAVADQLRQRKDAAEAKRIQDQKEAMQKEVASIKEVGKIPALAIQKGNQYRDEAINKMEDIGTPDSETGAIARDASNNVQMLNSFWNEDVVNFTDSLDEGYYNKDEVFKSIVDYTTDPETGEHRDIKEVATGNGMKDHVMSDLSIYNYPNMAKDYLNTLEDVVDRQVTSSLMPNGQAVANKIITKSGDLLKLDDKGDIEYNDDGTPTLNITPENVAAFRSFHEGFERYFNEEKGKNPEKKGTDIMEDFFKENYPISVKTDTQVKFSAPRQPRETKPSSGQQKQANAQERYALYRKSGIDGDGSDLLAIAKSGKGVVDSAFIADKSEKAVGDSSIKTEKKGETVDTGVRIIRDSKENEIAKEFTIVVDRNKAGNIPTSLVVDGNEISLDETKADKFSVFTIRIDKGNPRPGFLQFNQLHNSLLGSKNEIDPTDLMKADDLFNEELRKSTKASFDPSSLN